MCICDTSLCDCDCFLSSRGFHSAPSAGRLVPSITDLSLETAEDLFRIQQPPPHVVDYWFDQLGLSLDPIQSENPSNPLSFLTQSRLVNSGDDVSTLLFTLCCMTRFVPVYDLRDSLDLFRIVGFRSRTCQYKSPTGSSSPQYRVPRDHCAPSLSNKSRQVSPSTTSRCRTLPAPGHPRQAEVGAESL